MTANLLDNTDCAEIEVLLLFCDVIEPIGCFGDNSGWAGVGGLYAVEPMKYELEYGSK